MSTRVADYWTDRRVLIACVLMFAIGFVAAYF